MTETMRAVGTINNGSGARLGQIARAVFASAFDHEPIRWKRADEAGVLPVKHQCQRWGAGPHSFGAPLNRNAFLLGCLDLTQHESVEHLVVGLGSRRGSTTQVKAVLHWVGNTHSVGVPEGLRENLWNYVTGGRDHRVIVFHNHPRSVLDTVFDALPIASVAERKGFAAYLEQLPA